MEAYMRLLTIFTFTSIALVSAAHEAQAQASTAAQAHASIAARSRRSNAGYTGFSYGARPRPLPDGTPRWADFPVVTTVDPGSPAARVGIATGDVLLSVNGVDAHDPHALFLGVGTVATFRIRRGTAVREFVLRTIARPS
jgi:S1-C subfamily serine protease